MKPKTTNLEPDWGVDFGKPPQLEILHIEIRDDRLLAFGVSHGPIKLGDRFRLLNHKPPAGIEPDETEEDSLKFRLRVESITAYHKQLNRMNAGMTAALELSGDCQTVLDALAGHGWSPADDGSPQWRNRRARSGKFILTR